MNVTWPVWKGGLGMNSVIREAEQVVRKAKKLMRIVYQLAFVALSDTPYSGEAVRLLAKFVERGIITSAQLSKVLNDVQRWKERRYWEPGKSVEEIASRVLDEVKKEIEGGAE